MNKQLVYHVAPDKNLENWEVVLEGKKTPKAKGLSKAKALKTARKFVEKRAMPALVFVHKTRYIIEKQLQFSS